MPRIRRAAPTSEFQADQVKQLRLKPIEVRPRSLRDSAEFVVATVELERVRGLRVHPESPTIH